MKSVEKGKTQKLIDKIQQGQFDENDIDSLFMKLRAYSEGFSIFKEVSDFVAHNDLRDRGLANQSLETMYLMMKYFHEYLSPNIKINLSKPFPLWIKKLMMLQVNKCAEEELRRVFNVTKQRLITRIDKSFKEDKKNKVAIHIDGKLSIETFNAIQYALGFISGKPSFSQNDLINEIVGVLNKNKIIFDEDLLRSMSDKITICVLLLFHNSKFCIGEKNIGLCEISSENLSISHGTKFVDQEGNVVDLKETFGNLLVLGTITINLDGKDLQVGHYIVSTNLPAEKWCEDKLFYIEPLSKEAPHYMCKRLKLDIELGLSDDFKIFNAKN